MSTKVFIPFRDRGLDPRRSANLEVVMAWWYGHEFDPIVISDGLSGDAQFNRHRAYNRAVEKYKSVTTFVFTEADMLIHPAQIREAVRMAQQETGLIVPFTEYRYMSDATTKFIRDNYYNLSSGELAEWWSLPPKNPNSMFDMRPESVMKNGASIGAVNVVSRKTLEETGGFTEATSGNWYDDNIIEEGFAFLTNKTRWVGGPAVHMYHLPGHTGDHLTDADRNATRYNKALLSRMRLDIKRKNKVAVRALMARRAGA